ncbi:hypothetical protein STRTUCAR8_04057 [Streptomyces turgidiscabies Car8]|uniref:Uncharacterized protein n=1 Tax=Streptomyces turgidiscabies (strain Car8) TaxID=698760 RepID=L7F1T8_STRT8|nr:hypothetical protein STRTUCAR8_04057 [Streptomyces turgidiscabies Car8]
MPRAQHTTVGHLARIPFRTGDDFGPVEFPALRTLDEVSECC